MRNLKVSAKKYMFTTKSGIKAHEVKNPITQLSKIPATISKVNYERFYKRYSD
jgi:hypothetical protein